MSILMRHTAKGIATDRRSQGRDLVALTRPARASRVLRAHRRAVRAVALPASASAIGGVLTTPPGDPSERADQR